MQGVKKHQQDPEEQCLVPGYETRQAKDHQRNNDEVQHQHGAHEPQVLGGLADRCKRNAQERREEQQPQDGVDRMFQGSGRTGRQKSDRTTDQEGHEVQADLMVIHSCNGFPGIHPVHARRGDPPPMNRDRAPARTLEGIFGSAEKRSFDDTPNLSATRREIHVENPCRKSTSSNPAAPVLSTHVDRICASLHPGPKP